jgi:hypothetical protein
MDRLTERGESDSKEDDRRNLFLANILSYLMPKDLCHFQETSSQYLHSKETEMVWKRLCWRRWSHQRDSLPESSCLRKDGKPSWRLTYKIWAHEMKIPHGRLMPMSQRVFGRNKGDGVNCWLYLRHSSDCLLLPARGSHDDHCLGHLRLCLQNTALCPTQFLLQTSFRVYLKGSPGTTELLPICGSELSARNGLLVETNVCGSGSTMTKTPLPPPLSEPITLSNLEFVVITLQVICPEGVTNEVDLLSCIDRIHVTGWRMNPHEREAREKEGEREGAAERDGTDEALSLGCKESNAFAFEVPVDDEERIWSAYETAPGGVILLREATLMRDRGT